MKKIRNDKDTNDLLDSNFIKFANQDIVKITNDISDLEEELDKLDEEIEKLMFFYYL